MPYSFWENIAETPWWVAVTMVGFFYLAYAVTKPHVVSSKTLLTSNMMYLVLILVMLFTIIHASLPFLFAFLGIGTLLGWLHYQLTHVKAIKDKSAIYLPGSWLLTIALAILIPTKYYYFGAQIFFDYTALIKQEKFIIVMSSLTGLLAGLTVGRSYYVWRCMKHGPFMN